jgi:hypothetical protein
MKTMIETHGKVEGEPTTLEQVWGFNAYARYGTLSEAEYEQSLREMNRSDLENHARKVGVVIVESSVRLKDKLTSEFHRYVASLEKSPSTTSTNTKREGPIPKNTLPEDVRNILAEGR